MFINHSFKVLIFMILIVSAMWYACHHYSGQKVLSEKKNSDMLALHQ